MINPITDPNPGILVNKTGTSFMDFDIYSNNASFSNEDNPYGQFLFHMYTNMDNIKDTNKSAKLSGFKDKIIPLNRC